MEQKIEIPIIREDDEATMENIDTTTPTLSSSKGSEDWENISEDWVSLFLDQALLDDHSRSLESYLQLDTILPATNDHFSLQDPVADSLLRYSTNDQLFHGDLVLASSSNIIEDLFGKEDSPSLSKLDLIHPKIEPSYATSSTNSLTQVSGDSSLGMDVNLRKAYKEGNQDFPIILKQELNSKVSSSFDSLKFGGESEFANNDFSPNNDLQGSYCKEGKIGCGHEGVSKVEIPSTTSQLEAFGVRRLQSITNAIKVGLLRRSNNDIKESNKPHICEEESFGLQDKEVSKDQHSNHSNVESKREGGNEDGEKKCAQLERNCESAQNSKKRKNIYVHELEDKLQTMTTTIAELNTTINHLTIENVNLRRKIGYNYYPAPGVFLPRPEMPMHIWPIRSYFGMVAGRPMYLNGQMSLVPIPQMKTQIPTCSSKRTMSTTTNEGGNKKRKNMKVVCVASIVVMGLFYLAMLFGSFDQSFNGSRGVDDYSHRGNMQVGEHLLTNLNEGPNPLNNTCFSKGEYGPGWAPLEPREYGPEREGVPSVHTQQVAKELAFESQNVQLNVGITITTTNGIESSITQSINRNTTLATSSSHDYFSFKKVPLRLESEVVPTNTIQYFSASMFNPSTNSLIKLYRNLTIQTVMVGDKATKKQFEKKRKSRLNKRENKKQVATFVVKALDNLASKECKAVKNTSTRPFVIVRPFSRKEKFVAEVNNPILPVLQQSLQQLIFGSLHDPETDFVVRDLIKKIKSQPPSELHVDNSKAVVATQRTFYSFTPYDAAPKGPLNSWFFSGLVTEPISLPKRNISDIKEEAMPLPIKNEERFETLTFWNYSLQRQPFIYNQFFQKKTHKMNTCSMPTLSKLFWRNKELTKFDSRQCLASDRPTLHTGICTELFKFDATTTKTSTKSSKHDSTLKVKTMAESMAVKSTQGSPDNVISPFAGHGVPRNRRDPFVVPLPPKKAKATTRKERCSNGTDPKTESTVKEQMHNQNLQHGMSNMVVLVLVEPEDNRGNSGQKGTTKGWSQIFVVVLVDNQKYVTYSCIIPSFEPRVHVVAE